MGLHTADNVVAFNEARARGGQSATTKRNVKPESVGVINDCRDMALNRICAALSETFNKIEDELFELAGRSPDRETQNMYLDARNQAREKRKDIEAAFRSQFVRFFEKKVTGENAADTATTSFTLDSLTLVEDQDLTENIAVSDLAKRLTDKCDEELRALSQRMGFLLSEPELTDDANPIAPDTVVKALKAACDQITAGFQTRLTVLKMLEQHMAAEMLSVYKDINTHLVSKQIMPVVRPTFRRAPGHSARRSASASTSQATSQDPALGTSAPSAIDAASASGSFGAFSASRIGLPPADQAVELFHTLQQLMAGGISFDTSSADAATPPREYSSVTTGSFAPVPPSASMRAAQSAPAGQAIAGESAFDAANSGALIASLSRLQQRTFPESAMRQTATLAAVDENAALSGMNVLHELKQQGLTQGSSQVDAMTIDIVAMLFDFVFDDKAIPDAIKALIARLQIPVLKVAILDKAFFSKKSHPVRRLLDTLADASVAFAGEASREDALYQKIESIVDQVQEQFDTDVAVFERAVAELDAYLSAREAANAEVIEQSARAMHEREKREMARLIAQAEVERVGGNPDLPPPVDAMLKGPWARVLERIYLRDGGRSARFADAIETAEQLVWSVQPKADAAQRKDLVTALPLMLRRLQEGLDIAAVDRTDRERFFEALVDCHAAAVKAGLRGESVSVLFATVHGDASVTPLFERLFAEERERASAAAKIDRSGVARIHLSDDGVQIEELTPADHSDVVRATSSVALEVRAMPDALDMPGHAVPASEHAREAVPTSLKRGTWIEFIQANGSRLRAKLSWVSPLKGMYLFTNPGASEALSIAPEALSRQLAAGVARILEESSLIDRAVDRMVTSLSGANS
jgi:hypothetical protein